MAKNQSTTVGHNLECEDWAAYEFQVLCEDLLARSLLRRGPLVFQDSQLQAMIAAGSLAAKAKSAVKE